MVKVSDGVYSDFRPFGRVVRIFHFSSSKVKFLHDYSILLNIGRELKIAYIFNILFLFDFWVSVKFL